MNISIIYDHWLTILAIVFGFALGRYFVLAGIAWLFCYKPGLQKLQRFKIQKRPASARQLRNELMFSLSTITIFSLVGMTVCALYKRGCTKLYTDIQHYGWPYFACSIVLMVIVHDAYF